MVVPVQVCDAFDNTLRARVDEAWAHYSKEHTSENFAVYRRAFHQFTEWVLQGKLPEGERLPTE